MKKNEKIKDDIDRKCHKVKKIKELKPLVLDKHHWFQDQLV